MSLEHYSASVLFSGSLPMSCHRRAAPACRTCTMRLLCSGTTLCLNKLMMLCNVKFVLAMGGLLSANSPRSEVHVRNVASEHFSASMEHSGVFKLQRMVNPASAQ